MRLIITTLGRIRNQETLNNLPESIADRVELWVQDHEYELSCKYYDGVFSLPPEIRNLGQTRQWLLDHYRGEKIVLMDDDLTFYWRASPPDWHLTTPPPAELERMFAEIESLLDRYAHVGVSGREGQNYQPSPGTECDRYMRFLAYNTAMFPEHVRMDRVSGMSDFDTNLQLLRAGLPSYILCDFAQGQRSTQSPGGCSNERTHQTHFEEVRRICEMHAGLVVPRKKVNKSGGEFGQRDEVTVSWKMALGWDTRAREPTLLEQSQTEAARLRRELAEALNKLDDLAVELSAAYTRIRALESPEPVIPDRRKRKLDISPSPRVRKKRGPQS